MSENFEDGRKKPMENLNLDAAAKLLVDLKFPSSDAGASAEAEILLHALNLDDYNRARIRLGTSASLQQMFIPAFRTLFINNPAVREQTLRELAGLGLDEARIEEYITHMGNSPSLLLRLRIGGQGPAAWENQFVSKVNEFMFRTLQAKLREVA